MKSQPISLTNILWNTHSLRLKRDSVTNQIDKRDSNSSVQRQAIPPSPPTPTCPGTHLIAYDPQIQLSVCLNPRDKLRYKVIFLVFLVCYFGVELCVPIL